MKAKDYENLYWNYMQENGGNREESVTQVFIILSSEVNELYDKRNGKSEGAFIGVVKEIDQKWRAFARLVVGIDQNGFCRFWHDRIPELRKYMNAEGTRFK